MSTNDELIERLRGECRCGCYSGGCSRPEGCRCGPTCPCSSFTTDEEVDQAASVIEIQDRKIASLESDCKNMRANWDAACHDIDRLEREVETKKDSKHKMMTIVADLAKENEHLRAALEQIGAKLNQCGSIATKDRLMANIQNAIDIARAALAGPEKRERDEARTEARELEQDND